MPTFSLPVRLTHLFDFLFLSLLVRSGIEILGAHPKLYWRDHCSPDYVRSSTAWCAPSVSRIRRDRRSIKQQEAHHTVIHLFGSAF
jgi:hypothetical protein